MTGAERTIALLHPGSMGVTVGSTLRAGGHVVRWLEADRSAATRARAEAAGFEPHAGLATLLAGAEAVISVCPPDQAVSVAEQVAGADFRGWYVDANAVAPATVARLQQLLGERLVDGGIIGPPARSAGTTRLYLSGAGAAEAAGWFTAGPLTAVPIKGASGASPGAASALKMCYAAYTKGTSALLLGVRALADHEGITDALLEEWALSQPGLAQRSVATARGTAGRAWRFVGEMAEIAATFDAAGLPGGFHLAAAELYQRMAGLKDREATLDDVVEALLAAGSAGSGGS